MPNLKSWSEKEIDKIRQGVDRLFDDFCLEYGLPPVSVCTPGGVCISETEDALTVTMPLRGMSPEDLTIQVSETTLTISGKREDSFPGGKTHSRFHQEITLPSMVVPDKAKANTCSGMIAVTVPKTRQTIKKIVTIIVE